MIPPRQEDPYIAWRPPFPDLVFGKEDTALLVIDMQYLDAHWDHGMCLKVREAGFEKDLEYYRDRLAVIVPNIRRLQGAFRAAGMEVIHTRIQSMTADGRDRGPSHKKLGHAAPPDTREAQILDELKPVRDELVFNKTAGSVFLSTSITYVLRNLGIRNLVVVGVVTTGCVHTAVTDAADLGFSVGLVEDGCAALVPEMHWNSIRILRDVYAKIMTTEEVIGRITALQ
ncbi:MAG TPA: cysteine hydrolase [Candidatus Methylomirabilis sp.]|nr:cysteine hydrolase [Candidatus Methylomirabilis sp.]